jgi:glucokinase
MRRDMKKLYIGIEIGASKHQAVLGDADGKVLHTEKGAVVIADGARGILAWMREAVPRVAAMACRFDGTVASVGVGFGGVIESATGKSLLSVQVDGWLDFPLKTWFEEAFGYPAVVLNDTVAGGWAEYISGSGQGARNFFYTNIGSGIGGMFVIDGQYYDGSGYGAAYLGHTYIPDWTSAVPGASCKVEDMCSGFAIERRLRTRGYVPGNSRIMDLCGGEIETVRCPVLADAARAQDPFAKEEIDRIARSFAIGLSNVVTLFSPDRITIGGGVARMGDLLLDPVRKYTDELVFSSCKGKFEIVRCRHDDAAVPVGAILYAARTPRGINHA